MSRSAPWVSLCVDTFDSPMFDDSAMGVRHSWTCLLLHTKAQGRAGKVRFRDMAFASQYRLHGDSVSEMLRRATEGGAITRQGDFVIVTNWSLYQDHKARSAMDEDSSTGGGRRSSRKESPPPVDMESGETPSTRPLPLTTNTSQNKEPPKSPSIDFGLPLPTGFDTPDFCREWTAFCEHRAALSVRKSKPVPWSERAARAILAKLGCFDLRTATMALQDAISAGWTGVFPKPDDSGGNGKQPRNKPRPSIDPRAFGDD